MDMNDPVIGFTLMGVIIVLVGFGLFWLLRRLPTSESQETPYLMGEIRSLMGKEPQKVVSGDTPDEIDVFYSSIMPDISRPLVRGRRHSKLLVEGTTREGVEAKGVVLRTARSGGHLLTFMYMERAQPAEPLKDRLDAEDTAIHTTDAFGMNSSPVTCFHRNGWLGAIRIISCAKPYQGSDTLSLLKKEVRRCKG